MLYPEQPVTSSTCFPHIGHGFEVQVHVDDSTNRSSEHLAKTFDWRLCVRCKVFCSASALIWKPDGFQRYWWPSCCADTKLYSARDVLGRHDQRIPTNASKLNLRYGSGWTNSLGGKLLYLCQVNPRRPNRKTDDNPEDAATAWLW